MRAQSALRCQRSLCALPTPLAAARLIQTERRRQRWARHRHRVREQIRARMAQLFDLPVGLLGLFLLVLLLLVELLHRVCLVGLWSAWSSGVDW